MESRKIRRANEERTNTEKIKREHKEIKTNMNKGKTENHKERKSR